MPLPFLGASFQSADPNSREVFGFSASVGFIPSKLDGSLKYAAPHRKELPVSRSSQSDSRYNRGIISIALFVKSERRTERLNP